MQWGESCAALWLYCFHSPQRLCARVTGEELEEEKDENAKNAMDVFNVLVRFRVKEWVSLSSVCCALLLRRLYLPGLHSVER